MTIAKTTPQSLAWRIYAGLTVPALGLPFLYYFLSQTLSTGSLGPLSVVCAVIGVVAWAYGYRLGPRLAWRTFAILFSLMIAWVLGELARSEIVARFHEIRPSAFFAFTTLCALLIPAIIALFRLSADQTKSDRRLAKAFD